MSFGIFKIGIWAKKCSNYTATQIDLEIHFHCATPNLEQSPESFQTLCAIGKVALVPNILVALELRVGHFGSFL